jgi:hypothetical protein
LPRPGGLAGRGARFRAANGALVIDESYNANPVSMRATTARALDTQCCPGCDRVKFSSLSPSLAVTKLPPWLAGRGARFRAANGALVIDESYNANPVSMRATLASTAASTARALDTQCCPGCDRVKFSSLSPSLAVTKLPLPGAPARRHGDRAL